MSGKVVLFAQQKGGAGKTTLLTQLAAPWARAGRKLTLVDLDPQRSLAGWVDERARATGGALEFELRESSQWRASTDLGRARRESELVLVDCPGSTDNLLRGALREADLVVAPCQPSAPDAWAAKAILKMAARDGVAARVVLNRVPPRGGPTGKVVETLEAAGATLFATRIGARIAFANAFLEGRSVSEIANARKAADEIAALAKEITQALR